MRRVIPVMIVSVLIGLHAITGIAGAAPPAVLLKALARFMSKNAAGDAAGKLTKEVGEEAVQKFTSTVLKEGGEETLERASALAVKHGSDIVRAIDNSPSVTPILKAFDDLPVDQVPKAAARLAAGARGRELAETVIRYGSPVLKAEMLHPGVGGRVVRTLGSDGASLCGKLTNDQAISLGRYVDDIAHVPPSQRKSLLELINKDKDRFFDWLGRFVEANPGKTIGSVAMLAVVLPNSERIMGGADDVEIAPDGTVKLVSRPGLAGRAGEAVHQSLLKPASEGLSWLTRGLGLVVVLGVGSFAAIKLWGAFQHEKNRIVANHNHDKRGNL